MRHAATEADYADQVAAVIGDCSTQRMVSADGWQQARSIGAAIATLRIPVGEVLSSEYCRAWQTADLAFGQFTTTPHLNFARAEDYSPEDIALMRDNVLPLLAASVPAGNRVIVGHDDPFEAATGIYPEPQGVVYVLRPDGHGGADVLGAITPNDWEDLVN
jgi:phosphohistidine phosphatase SixA